MSLEQKVYIDTSALIPFYFTEIYSDRLQTIFAEHSNLIISDLTRIEFVSTLKKKIRIGHTTASETDKVLSVFDSHIESGVFQTISVEPDHFKQALKIINKTENSLRSLDAFHLGIIQHEKLTCLSFDKVFIDTALEFEIPLLDHQSG